MSRYTVRPLEAGELPPAMALVRRVFDRFEAPDYPPEGVEEFYRFIAPDAVEEMTGAGVLRCWGAFAGNELCGVLGLRPPTHLCLLFVEPAHHRRGVARLLLDAALAHCRAGGAGEGLTVHASPYGLEAYRRMGFVETGPRTQENGLIYIPMRRALPGE